ncbi:cytochrome P450 [Amycolatopsis tucumanensis]|uniref:Cytochrome P450 n=1 Tax=Amycolatopsis tucumanensis TaxID=401106 RepID=A0ABP7HH59_9PSEU|nr:cytochrome P450 [Amycolatopsis tucumanensis]MCF6421401.1 cytochrome P450 [Amycolatopsis tucumanensis]
MTAAKVRFNPFDAGFRRDPYPLYRQLRETEPVHRALGTWVLTRHADVRAVLRDRTFSAGLIPRLVAEHAGRLTGSVAGRIERLGRGSLVFTDNPDHARLRGLVNRAFSAQAVARLRPLVHRTTDELLGRARVDGGMDVIAGLAAPLPVAVLAEWMGLSAQLRAHVAAWTHDIRFLLEPGLMTADDYGRVGEVVETFVAALTVVVRDRARHPGHDLVSALLAARTAGGDRLGEEELVFLCIMCFVAGNETTKSLIGNGVLALLRHPEQAAALAGRPDLVPGAVAEALRYDSPLQLTKRVATRDVELGGHRIAEGDQVLLCLGAANRDPAVFPRPDVFDITRDTGGHLGFGHGMHGCLGGLLAQTQAEVAVAHLSRLDLEPAGDPEWQDHSFIVRGLTALPVIVRGTR